MQEENDEFVFDFSKFYKKEEIMEDEDNEFSDVNNQSSITTAFAEQDAGTLVEICDDDGKAIVSFEAPKAYDSILATAPEIIKGNTYVVKVDGETIGTIEN